MGRHSVVCSRCGCNTLKPLVQRYSACARYHAHRKCNGIRSGNFGVWRGDFLAVNSFDDSFSGWGHEDADLVLRLHNPGARRKSGFCATEVLHRWYRANSRRVEQAHRAPVAQWHQSGLAWAQTGLDRVPEASTLTVSQWTA